MRMFRIAALLCALLVTGCATSPENKVRVSITNTTDQILVVRVGSSLLGTSVTIPPGITWSGDVDRRWLSSSAWMKIEYLKIQ